MASFSIGGGNSGATTHTSSSTNSNNMTPDAAKALASLIATLAGGGTPVMQQTANQKATEVAALQKQGQDYSKASAFSDAQGAMSAEATKILQQLLPQLTRSAEGAGTSQNALKALLEQQAGIQAAQAAATTGLQAASNYGQVANQSSNILAGLLTSEDPAVKALLAALNIAKGSVGNSTTTSTQPIGVAPGAFSNNSGGGNSSFAPSGFPDVGVRSVGGMSAVGPASDKYGSGGIVPTMTPTVPDQLASFKF